MSQNLNSAQTGVPAAPSVVVTTNNFNNNANANINDNALNASMNSYQNLSDDLLLLKNMEATLSTAIGNAKTNIVAHNKNLWERACNHLKLDVHFCQFESARSYGIHGAVAKKQFKGKWYCGEHYRRVFEKDARETEIAQARESRQDQNPSEFVKMMEKMHQQMQQMQKQMEQMQQKQLPVPVQLSAAPQPTPAQPQTPVLTPPLQPVPVPLAQVQALAQPQVAAQPQAPSVFRPSIDLPPRVLRHVGQVDEDVEMDDIDPDNIMFVDDF